METPVTAAIWAITAGLALLVVGTDLVWAFLRRNRLTTVRESVSWTLFYIVSAVAFGFFLISWQNPVVGEEYFATWITQYPLSIDNLFVFIIILAKLNIPKEKQQLALLSGILFALSQLKRLRGLSGSSFSLAHFSFTRHINWSVKMQAMMSGRKIA